MPKKEIRHFSVLLLIVSMIVSHLFLLYTGGLGKYIITPVLWMAQALILYMLIGYKHRKYFKGGIDIASIVCVIVIVYQIIFYLLGVIIGYGKNPFSSTLNGITINLFSSVGTIIAIEYIKSIYVNILCNIKKIINIVILFFVFVLIEINLLSFINSLNHYTDIIDFVIRQLFPICVTTALTMYLGYISGFKSAAIYRTFLILPSIFIPAVPLYNDVVLFVFEIGLALFTFLFIQHSINKKVKQNSKQATMNFNLKEIIISVIVLSFIVATAFGAFPIVPVSIISGSMEPIIKKGDVVIIKKCGFDDVNENDVIQYRLNNHTVVHRVKSIDNLNGETVLTTKGDNNALDDKKPVKSNQIIGKVKLKIPFLGYPSYLIKKILGRAKDIEI